jgi:hypothetical protein
MSLLLVGILAVGGLLTWSLLTGGSEPVATTLVDTVTTTVNQPEVRPIDIDRPVPLTILAVRPNNPSFALLDFEGGTSANYPPGVHHSSGDATDGVGITPSGDVITYSHGEAVFVFGDGLDREPSVVRASEFRNLSGVAPLVQPLLVPPDGQRMWLVQPGLGWGDNVFPTLIDLVDVATGELILHTEAGPSTRAVGATYSGLVLESVNWTDTGDGFEVAPGSEEALLLAEDGTLSDIGAGHVVEAGADTIVRLGCAEQDGCPLTITDSDGSNERLAPVPVDVDGQWMHLGGPGIPSTSFPLSALSPNGSSIVMGIGNEFDVNDVPAEVTVGIIDVTAGTTSLRGELGPGLVTWSRDSDWLAVVGNTDVRFISVDINNPEEIVEVEDVIPEGHFPLASG